MGIDDLIGGYYNSKACVIFQIMSILYLLGILVYVGIAIGGLYRKKLKPDIMLNIIMSIGGCVLMYFMYRLLFGMCLNTV